MPALARGQENTTGIINWFLTVNGILTDADTVEYRIFDITGGLPGTQIFPLPAPNFEDVSGANPGHFSTGSYYAYDIGPPSVGWTPELTAAIGTHRIEWRWKISPSAPFQSGQEDFEILVQSAGSSADLYCSIQDIRDAGLTDTVAFPDADVLASIELWQQFLERACRQWFVPKSLILTPDGTDSDTLHFGVPIISIDFIKINDQVDELDADRFKVYSALRYPDDRHNPRIKLVNDFDLDIFTAPIIGRRLLFRKGRQNQEIKGTFGYIEEDGNTPKLIVRALCKIVIQKLTNPLYVPVGTVGPAPPPALTGNLIEEWTDGHKRKYGAAGGAVKPRKPGLVGITDDQEVLDIIRLYRAPLGVASPANPSHHGTL